MQCYTRGNGALSSLKIVYLRVNRFGDVGVQALAEASASGALPALIALYIVATQPALPAKQVADAINNCK